MCLSRIIGQSYTQGWTIQACIAEHIPSSGFWFAVRPVVRKWCSCHPPLAAYFRQEADFSSDRSNLLSAERAELVRALTVSCHLYWYASQG